MLFNLIKLILLNLIILINLKRSTSEKDWQPFACNGKNDTEILTSTLRHVVIHFNSLYFFFESYVISIYVPLIYRNPKKNESDPELGNFLLIYGPMISHYNDMYKQPNIMEHRFDKYTEFEYVKSDDEVTGKEAYMVNTPKNLAYFFETGKAIGMSGKLTEYNNWVVKYAYLKENQVGFNHYQGSRL